MMTFDEYKEEVVRDAMERIEDGRFEDFDECFDDLFLSVTGNDNGSYYCDRERAREACSGMVFDEEFIMTCKWHFNESDIVRCLMDGPEAFDVLVRIVALYEAYPELEEAYEKWRTEE